MTAAVILIAVAAIFVGSTLQRLSGTGVGLVVAPTLALAMGPHVGVFVANSTTVISGFLIMLAVIREVDWKRFWILAAAAALGAVPAALMVRDLSSAWLNIVVGAVVLFALALTFGMPRLPRLTSSALTAAAGIVGGFLNTSAGVAAPAMVIYARFARWEQRSFAATLQPTFMTMGLLSVVAKLSVGATSVSQLPPWWLLPIIVVTVLLGIGLGGRLARRIAAPQARLLAIVLAGLGGVVAIVRGAFMLAG